jgi:hypothetical protein
LSFLIHPRCCSLLYFFCILFICFFYVLRYNVYRLFYCIIFGCLFCLPLSNMGLSQVCNCTFNVCYIECVPQSQVCNRSLDMTCAADSTWFVLVRPVAHHVHPFVMCKLRVVMFLLMRNILNVSDVGCAPQSQVCNRSLDTTCAADSTWFVRVRSVAQSIRLSCASCVWSFPQAFGSSRL